jgi:plasmid stabilization system protein ParE
MPSVSLTLSRLADNDIEEIAAYTTERYGLRQATAFRAIIQKALLRLASSPAVGRQFLTTSGARYLQINAGRHAIFYEQTSEGIVIIRILLLAMDFDQHL